MKSNSVFPSVFSIVDMKIARNCFKLVKLSHPGKYVHLSFNLRAGSRFNKLVKPRYVLTTPGLTFQV